jgi:hypothetical protein
MKVASVLWVLLACASCASSNKGNACETNTQCSDPALPYCVQGACVACDGAATCTQEAPRCEAETHTCAMCLGDTDCNTYPTALHCDTAAGACVQCLTSDQCDGATPVCDANQSCRACVADDECGSGVCEAAAGTCTAEASVIYATATAAATATCTKADPCTLTKAFTLIAANRNTVKLAAGTYADTIDYAGMTNVSVHGAGATLSSTLALRSGATMSVTGITFHGDGGLYCMPAATGGAKPNFDLSELTFDQTGTTSGNPYAIQASACVIKIKHSTFKVASGGSAIYASGEATVGRGTDVTIDRSSVRGGEPAIGVYNYSSFHVINSELSGFLPLQTHPQAFAFSWDNTSINNTVEFSTVYDSHLACGNTGIVYLKTYSSIFYNTRTAPPGNTVPTATLAGTNCEHHFTLAYPQFYMPPGSDNFYDMNPMLKDPANGDFHLATGSPAIDVADPGAMLDVDYEGTARPQGAARDLGALEYK